MSSGFRGENYVIGRAGGPAPDISPEFRGGPDFEPYYRGGLPPGMRIYGRVLVAPPAVSNHPFDAGNMLPDERPSGRVEPLQNRAAPRPMGRGLSELLPPGVGQSNGAATSTRTGFVSSAAGGAFGFFNQSQEGFWFHYANGGFGRGTPHFFFGWGDFFFPGGCGFFPYYFPGFIPGVTVFSPYGLFYGMFPPYISSNYVYYAPPPYVYIPYPVYEGNSYEGYQTPDVDNYYLNNQDNQYRVRETEPDHDKILLQAVGDIAKAWTDRDIQFLAKHVRRDARIAVYLRGKYQYSLDASDYLDMTRDAFRSTGTVKFTLDKPRFEQNGVYVVTGRHVYRDKAGDQHTVQVSYVLQRMDDEYYITQVGTAPDTIRPDTSQPGDLGAR